MASGGPPPGVENARVDISIEGKTAAYENALKQMPNITEQYARRSAQALQRGLYVQQAKELAGLVDKNKTAGADIAKSWNDVAKQIGAFLGGPFAKVSQVVTELVPKASAASSAMGGIALAGGAAAATAVGLATLAMAMVRVADAALLARDRLIEAGKGAEIPASARDSLDRYKGATKDLRTEWDLLVVSMGANTSGPLSQALGILSIGMGVLRDARDTVNELRLFWGLWTGAMTLANPALIAAGGALSSMAEAAAWLNGETKELTKSQLDYAQSQAEIDDEQRRKNAERGAKQVEQQRKANEAAAVADIALAKQHAQELDRIAQAAAKAEAALLAKRHDEHVNWLMERAAIELEWTTQLAESRHELESTNADLRVELAEDAAKRIRDAEVRWVEDAAKAKLAAEGAALRELADTRAQYRENAKRDGAAIVASDLDAISTVLGAAIEAQDEKTKAGRKAARTLFAIQKGIGMASVAVDTGAAILKAFALYGPPPSPPGIASAAAAVLAGGVQLAAISSMPMPSFYGGVGRVPGVPGQGTPTMLHGRERTLTSNAADNWGDAFIDAMNAGLRPLQALGGGGDGGGDVVLDGAKMGRYVRRTARRGAQYGAASPYMARRT